MSRLKNSFGWFSLLGFLVGGILFLFFEKGDIVLWVNTMHHPVLDLLMKYWTYLGDGIMLLALLIGMLFYRYYFSIAVVVLTVLILLFSQGLKRTIFEGWKRPTAYFDEERDWNRVEGVDIATTNTFPSGHTTTGFAIWFFLSLVINRRWFYILGFILAVGVGFSRIYLLQHFFVDTYFGAALGMLAGLLTLVITRRILGPIGNGSWPEKSLRDLFRKA